MSDGSKDIAYIIIFNPSNVEVDQRLHQFLIQNKLIKKWWNFLPATYAITSNGSTLEIRDSIRQYLGKGTFFVAPFNPVAADGFLPRKAWDAFKEDIESSFKTDG